MLVLCYGMRVCVVGEREREGGYLRCEHHHDAEEDTGSRIFGGVC